MEFLTREFESSWNIIFSQFKCKNLTGTPLGKLITQRDKSNKINVIKGDERNNRDEGDKMNVMKCDKMSWGLNNFF